MNLIPPKARALVAFATAAALSILAAIFFLRLWRADLRVPFNYSGDGLLFSYIVKSVVDHGWYWRNPNVGAPSGLQMLDYAVSAHDSGHLLLVRIMSLSSGDWALVFNSIS